MRQPGEAPVTDERCALGVAFADLIDYWTGDLQGEQAAHIEQHVFECGECAKRLSEVDALARGISAVVRQGHFHGVVTDAILNQLARDGFRMRTFALQPGQTVACAVWADDDLVVTRMRANLSGLDRVTVVTQLHTGEELGRLSDVPVRPGQGEIIDVISAGLLRKLPATRVRMIVSGVEGGTEQVIGEYTLEHAGPMTRPS